MLTLDGNPFTVGKARYYDHEPGSSSEQARIYVRIAIEGLEASLVAILDTGAPWCILRSDFTDIAGGEPIDEEDIALTVAKWGTLRGKLHRIRITLVAEEGESIQVESTVFVPLEWDGPNFIGYNGLLERIRFGLDPSQRYLYFGPVNHE